MLSKKYISLLFTTSLIFVMALGYEVSLINYFPALNMIAIFALVFGQSWMSSKNLMTESSLPVLLFFLACFWAMFGVLFRDGQGYFEFSKYAVIAITSGAIFFQLSAAKVRLIFSVSAYIGLLFSCFGLVLYLTGGGERWWPQHAGRLTSIWHDPNYFSVFVGYSTLYFLGTARERRLGATVVYVAILALTNLLTFSKGGVIAFIAAVIYLFLYNGRFYLALFSAAAAALFYKVILNKLLAYMSSIDMFRSGMGLNRRDIFWEIAFSGANANPIFGNGLSAVRDSISSMGFEEASFHNYYIEAVYINGYPYLAIILVFLFLSLRNLAAKNHFYSAILLFFILAANNFSFSIGGVGFLSFLFTIASFYGFMKERQQSESCAYSGVNRYRNIVNGEAPFQASGRNWD